LGKEELNSTQAIPVQIKNSGGKVEKISMIAAGYFHSAFLSEGGHLWVCGRGSEGQLGFGRID